MRQDYSALDHKVHLHCLLPDAVFNLDASTGKVFCKRAGAPTTGEVVSPQLTQPAAKSDSLGLSGLSRTSSWA